MALCGRTSSDIFLACTIQAIEQRVWVPAEQAYPMSSIQTQGLVGTTWPTK